MGVVVAAVCVPFIPGSSVPKHGIRGRDLRGIPRTDILVERGGVSEHAPHVRDLRGIPRTDVLVKRGDATEHELHVRDLRGIPRRDIRVELTLVSEQLPHVRHLRHVPGLHFVKPSWSAICGGTTRHAIIGGDTEAFIHRNLEPGGATVSEAPGERARHACESQHGGQNRHRGPRFPRRSPAPASASEPRGHGSRQPELASREDAFKSPASEKPAQAECWSGSLATRVRVIRRPHRAARRYEHVCRQTRRIRLRWGRHPCADKARALLETPGSDGLRAWLEIFFS